MPSAYDRLFRRVAGCLLRAVFYCAGAKGVVEDGARAAFPRTLALPAAHEAACPPQGLVIMGLDKAGAGGRATAQRARARRAPGGAAPQEPGILETLLHSAVGLLAEPIRCAWIALELQLCSFSSAASRSVLGLRRMMQIPCELLEFEDALLLSTATNKAGAINLKSLVLNWRPSWPALKAHCRGSS